MLGAETDLRRWVRREHGTSLKIRRKERHVKKRTLNFVLKFAGLIRLFLFVYIFLFSHKCWRLSAFVGHFGWGKRMAQSGRHCSTTLPASAHYFWHPKGSACFGGRKSVKTRLIPGENILLRLVNGGISQGKLPCLVNIYYDWLMSSQGLWCGWKGTRMFGWWQRTEWR